ncbi:hypothetical protein Bca101_027863 [Brassica carinata]
MKDTVSALLLLMNHVRRQKIRMNKVVRSNLRVRLDLEMLSLFTIALMSSMGSVCTSCLFDAYLKPYFLTGEEE